MAEPLGDSAPLWRKTHDALREYHRLRGRHATTSVIDKAWRAYRRAKSAAEAAETGRDDTHEHSWRVEGDGEYEPFHNVCETCEVDAGDASTAALGGSSHPDHPDSREEMQERGPL